MREIDWIEGIKGRAGNGTEVRVYVEKDRKHTRCVFYGTSIVKVTRKEYIKIGISKERMYFDEANERGFKLGKSGKNVYVKLPGIKQEWEGDYKLIYDADMKLWYLERRTK